MAFKPIIIVISGIILLSLFLSSCTPLDFLRGARVSFPSGPVCNQDTYIEDANGNPLLRSCSGALQVDECRRICPLGGCTPENPGTYQWAILGYCSTSQNAVCAQGNCYVGCAYEGVGYKNGQKACVDERVKKECVAPNVLTTDCSQTANPWCYSGTCIPMHPSQCFTHLSPGTRWRSNEPYLLNPRNLDGMSDSYVEESINYVLQIWENEALFDIFGQGSLISETLTADATAPDGKNEVFFGSLAGTPNPNAVAVTFIWFTATDIKEWDLVFNEAVYHFGNAETAPLNYYDLISIAAHEAGHAAGMGHANNVCTEDTMYYTAWSGKTKARTLEIGDITGIKALYGVSQ